MQLMPAARYDMTWAPCLEGIYVQSFCMSDGAPTCLAFQIGSPVFSLDMHPSFRMKSQHSFPTCTNAICSRSKTAVECKAAKKGDAHVKRLDTVLQSHSQFGLYATCGDVDGDPQTLDSFDTSRCTSVLGQGWYYNTQQRSLDLSAATSELEAAALCCEVRRWVFNPERLRL